MAVAYYSRPERASPPAPTTVEGRGEGIDRGCHTHTPPHEVGIAPERKTRRCAIARTRGRGQPGQSRDDGTFETEETAEAFYQIPLSQEYPWPPTTTTTTTTTIISTVDRWGTGCLSEGDQLLLKHSFYPLLRVGQVVRVDDGTRQGVLREARVLALRDKQAVPSDPGSTAAEGMIAYQDDLISPCLCSGTSKWVHRACLDRWRAVKHQTSAFTHCTECRFEFWITLRENRSRSWRKAKPVPSALS